MKKSFVTIVLLIGFAASSFASNQPVLNNKLTTGKAPELTQTEAQLLDQLNQELEVSLDEVLSTLEETPIEKVLVYNAQGDVILTQEKNIDLDKLPNSASLLMTEGNTQYYIAL